MSQWPPVPPQDQPPSVKQPSGQEWQLLEKVLMASVEEQRRARRWSIFFKLLTFGYLLFILAALGRSCSNDEHLAGMGRTSPHLAVVRLEGEIGGGRGGVTSEDVVESLTEAFDDKNSKAVVLAINSPGGSPVQSDEIWQEIRRQQKANPDKKVYALISDMGASGAYYIASAANEIWVNPSSLVGSIGVIMPNYGLSELTKKLGVEDRTMTAGEHKAILSMTKPIDPFEKEHIQGLLNNVHQHFIDAVKTGRGNRLKPNDQIFSGLFWTGSQAIGLGLADKTGSLKDLERQLKIDNSVDYTVEHSPFEDFADRLGSSMGQGLGAALKQSVNAEQDAKLQ